MTVIHLLVLPKLYYFSPFIVLHIVDETYKPEFGCIVMIMFASVSVRKSST